MFKKLGLLLVSLFLLMAPVSCAAKAFEKEINVVFMYEDELISHDTVTQFKNIKSPTLSEAYIPDGYKFFGWTPLDPNTISATDENFNEKYISAGEMVHWADVNEYATNTTVICKALMIDKNEIPKPYHYVVIAWYDKVATSGVDQNLMNQLKDALFDHLTSLGVSQTDLDSIVIRGYTGNVGTSCGQIMKDEDVDIMLGWGSKDNITTTGGMNPDSILETIKEFKVGEKNRTLHRLTDKETALVVFEWLQSDACRAIFA
ncbi:MAG: hypothetical protein E7180_01780 [Erysipelotrichaceae bacterium]|nr:hypothetical protein [Erysipelotrichaceae bacterium]